MWRFTFAFITSCALLINQTQAGDSSSLNVSVGGSAPSVCSFTSAARALSSDNMTLSGGGINSGLLSVNELVDETTARLNPASIQLEISGVCTNEHHLTMVTTRGGLTLDHEATVVSGNFIRHVNYRAQIEWAGRSAVLETDATAGKKTSAGLISGPNNGQLNVSIVIDDSNNDLTAPTLAGAYLDSLIVQIGLPL